jgi:hypothetical protein
MEALHVLGFLIALPGGVVEGAFGCARRSGEHDPGVRPSGGGRDGGAEEEVVGNLRRLIDEQQVHGPAAHGTLGRRDAAHLARIAEREKPGVLIDKRADEQRRARGDGGSFGQQTTARILTGRDDEHALVGARERTPEREHGQGAGLAGLPRGDDDGRAALERERVRLPRAERCSDGDAE